MTRYEVIKLTDEWLKSVPGTRKRIILIDKITKDGTYDLKTIEKYKQERYYIQHRLSKIINTVSTLPNED